MSSCRSFYWYMWSYRRYKPTTPAEYGTLVGLLIGGMILLGCGFLLACWWLPWKQVTMLGEVGLASLVFGAAMAGAWRWFWGMRDW